jgi:hypothetical protein
MDIGAITKNPEPKQADNKTAGGPVKKDGSRPCKYLHSTKCIAPFRWFEICKTCPYGYIYCFEAIVKNIFKKTIGLAISILSRDKDINRIQ